MDIENCESRTRERLQKESPGSQLSTRRAVAREMCRLLESGLLEQDLEKQTVGIDYLISRLKIREGEDNPGLKMKWNSWVGQMAYLHDGDYNQYQI